ncbi:MAG: BtpA/SgcQ family protein [Candidatus Rokubacteria bacterium]|nr:BtpA/SgcQ family protein [Candidatus Rokubacteria bacterium]
MDHGVAVNLAGILGVTKALIGMVHLLPLPGSPRWGGSIAEVIERALADARALEAGGLHALLVENHGDVPFTPGRVDAATVAAMTAVIAEMRRSVGLPLGVNVLKNDAQSGLAIAAATGATFIRVNVHVGAVVADQGIIESDAHTTLRYRRLLGADVKIFADVQAKHGAPLAPVELEQEARDCVSRGLADALVVSGKATGEATPLEDVKRVRSAVPDVPLLVGSGVTPDSVAELLSVADGAIVGTFLKRDGRLGNPVDPDRVKLLVEAAHAVRAERRRRGG